MSKGRGTPKPKVRSNGVRGPKELFASFFEDPTRENLRDLLKGNTGETKNLDFKEQWPATNGLVKHILAIANSGGGCVVVGVAESDDNNNVSTYWDRIFLKDK